MAEDRLTISEAERLKVVTRFTSGPYKTKGDASTNSPQEVMRIKSNADKFKAAPSAALWKPTYTASITNSTSQPTPGAIAETLVDAAFWYYVTGDASFGNPVKKAVLDQVKEGSTNWSGTIYKAGGSGDAGPAFAIAEWLKDLMYAVDYTKALWNDTEIAAFNSWLTKGTEYVRSNYDPELDSEFNNRYTGDYTLKKDKGDNPTLLYYGGPKVWHQNKMYNNRKCALASEVGEAGVWLGNNTFKESGKRFFKEFLMFGVYPTMRIADLERGTDYAKSPGSEKGFAYSYSALGALSSMADVFARAGDTSLYDYTTMGGTTVAQFGVDATAVPSGGTPKSLLACMKEACNLQNKVGSPIYGTALLANSTKADYRIDGVYAPSGWEAVYYAWFAGPNLYYKDAYLKNTYLRTGYTPFPANAPANGPSVAWKWSRRPASLLLAAGLEGQVNPYPTMPPAKQSQTIAVQSIGDKVFAPGLTFTVVAPASSALPTTTTVVSGPGSISGNVVTVTGAGTITLKTSQAGNGSYLPATDVLTNVIIKKGEQTITFDPIAQKSIDDAPFEVVATSSAGFPVTFASNNAVLLQLDPDSFSIQATGTASITANALGDANYNDAPLVLRTFPVVSTPVVSLQDVLLGKLSEKSYINLGTGIGKYSLYQWAWPGLGGSFLGYRFIFETGNDIPANVVKAFRVEYFDGDSWELLFPEVTNNTELVFDITFPEKLVMGKIRILSKGYSTRKMDRAVLYGVAQ